MKTTKQVGSKPGAKTAAPAKRRVFLVDDHAIVRRGLAELIGNEPDLAVCGEGEDAYGSLRVIRECTPDLCVIDVSLKDSDGIELLKELKAQLPELPVRSVRRSIGSRLAMDLLPHTSRLRSIGCIVSDAHTCPLRTFRIAARMLPGAFLLHGVTARCAPDASTRRCIASTARLASMHPQWPRHSS